MALIHLPQTKWGDGTGRQVILKGDFARIEEGLVESFELERGPSLEYAGPGAVRVSATGGCKARVMLCGFPSPLHPGLWVSGNLTDGRYRENAAPETLDLAAGGLWGTEKSEQWYCVYALAGAADLIFSLKAMPLMRVDSQEAQTIALRNNADSAPIGYGFAADELAEAKILILTGASRGEVRVVTANNSDNGTAGAITYGGSLLALAQGDWFAVLPNTNFRYLGMVLNDAAGNLAPFRHQGGSFAYLAPRTLTAGPLNGFTALDLGLVAPPTARRLEGYAAATEGAEVRLAVSYDGSAAALILHGPPPQAVFQGVQGALPFRCQVAAGHRLFLDNGNAAGQVVQITGWIE
jgi:hypothetical protein